MEKTKVALELKQNEFNQPSAQRAQNQHGNKGNAIGNVLVGLEINVALQTQIKN